MSLLDRTVAETGTAALEAENARLESEIKQQQLKEAVSSKSGGNQWQEYMLAQLEKTQEQVARYQKALTDAQLAAMDERMALLRSELDRLQAQPKETLSPGEQVRTAITDARALMELITPERTPPPPPANTQEAAVRAWTLRAQLDHERWQQDRTDRHTERMAEIQAQADAEAKRIAIEEQKAAQMTRFFEQTAPELLKVGRELLAQFLSPPAAVGGAVAPMLGPDASRTASPPPTAALPPDVRSAPCSTPGCGALLFRESWPEVICQRCGAIYRLHDAAAPPARPVASDDGEEGMIG